MWISLRLNFVWMLNDDIRSEVRANRKAVRGLKTCQWVLNCLSILARRCESVYGFQYLLTIHEKLLWSFLWKNKSKLRVWDGDGNLVNILKIPGSVHRFKSDLELVYYTAVWDYGSRFTNNSCALQVRLTAIFRAESFTNSGGLFC